jgi:hypothetical protein
MIFSSLLKVKPWHFSFLKKKVTHHSILNTVQAVSWLLPSAAVHFMDYDACVYGFLCLLCPCMYVFHDDGMEYGWMTKLRGWRHE